MNQDDLTRRAIAAVRASDPEGWRPVPDEALEGLLVTRVTALNLAVSDLGCAVRGHLPRPLRRLLGDAK